MRFSQGDDAPLSFAHHVPEAALTRLCIPLGRTRDDRAVQCAIVGQALVRHDGGRARTSYSRSGEWWKLDRYEDTPFGRSRVVGTVDALTKMGLLGGFVAKRGAHLAKKKADRLQSAFWATESLVAAMRGEAVEHRRPRWPVLLRDENGDPLPLPRTQMVDRLVRRMGRRNEAIAGIRLTVDPAAVARGKWRFSEHHWWGLGDKGKWTCIRAEPFPFMVQMFARGSFDLHGRMYGPWTGLPSARRAELLLNGEAVCEEEPDWSCLHLDLAYAMCGLRLDGDAYEVPGVVGVTRQQLKGAVNTAINAPTALASLRSLMQKRFERDKEGERKWPLSMTWDKTKAAMARIEERHAGIKHLFNSDAGVRLMRIDAEMAGQVMDACAKASIPCLPVHDSFNVPGRHKGFVEGVMAEVLDRTRNKLSGTTSTGYALARLHCARAEPGRPGGGALGATSVGPVTSALVEVPGPAGEAPPVPAVSTRNRTPAPSPEVAPGSGSPAPKEGPRTPVLGASPVRSVPGPCTTLNLAPASGGVPWTLQDGSPEPLTSIPEPRICIPDPEPHTSSREARTATSTPLPFTDPNSLSPAVPAAPWTMRLDMTDCLPAVVAIPDPHTHRIWDETGAEVRGTPVMLRPMAEALIAQGHDPYTPPAAPPAKVAPGLPCGIVPRRAWPYTADIR